MEKKVTSYRQGDVLVKKIDKLPEGLKKVEDYILAHGEFSGHAHFITSQNHEAVLMEDKDTGKMYLDIPESVLDAHLEHLLEGTGVWTKEHTKVAIPSGVYEVHIHQQWNPYAKAIEKVRD